jgi:7-cyano-7-deazaguanine synthase in queuosine biosynthesis
MKRVILNSGGLDSLALAVKFKNDELYSFHVHMGVPT